MVSINYCTQTLVYPSGCCIPIGLHHFQLVSSHNSPSSRFCESCFIVHYREQACIHVYITIHVKFLDVDVGKGGRGRFGGGRGGDLYRSLRLQVSKHDKLQTFQHAGEHTLSVF